mmetsp:Transcript_1749/g.4938  ORF Transcript_1749/g.4938 Transcript_1749/m.4938 type:complete len:271 (+) Transcript_1749:112-924(+)
MGGHRSLSPINHVRYTLCAIGVGALVGCLVVSLGALITGLYTARVQFGLKWYEGAGDGLARVRWWHGLWRLVWIAAVYTAMAAALVAYVAPKAQGSGLPEVKGFLNGSRIPGLWRFRTFLIKFFAIALVIGAGLPVGREGAAVYLGACLAHAAWSHGNLWWQGREAATDPKNQRLFTTIGTGGRAKTPLRHPIRPHPQKIHVVAAAPPRPASAEHLRGITRRPRRRRRGHRGGLRRPHRRRPLRLRGDFQLLGRAQDGPRLPRDGCGGDD